MNRDSSLQAIGVSAIAIASTAATLPFPKVFQGTAPTSPGMNAEAVSVTDAVPNTTTHNLQLNTAAPGYSQSVTHEDDKLRTGL